MRPRLDLRRQTIGRGWIRVLRALAAALSLALLTAPAAASPRIADAIVLVASVEAAAASSAPRRPSSRRASKARRASDDDRRAAVTREPPSSFVCIDAPAARGERLYLLDCALLR